MTVRSPLRALQRDDQFATPIQFCFQYAKVRYPKRNCDFILRYFSPGFLLTLFSRPNLPPISSGYTGNPQRTHEPVFDQRSQRFASIPNLNLLPLGKITKDEANGNIADPHLLLKDQSSEFRLDIETRCGAAGDLDPHLLEGFIPFLHVR
jgi:hypothetical protein